MTTDNSRVLYQMVREFLVIEVGDTGTRGLLIECGCIRCRALLALVDHLEQEGVPLCLPN